MISILYLYDRAIVDDLQKSFNPDNMSDPEVKVVDQEGLIQVLAQMKEDKIAFPVVSLVRNSSVNIDSNRCNFTWMHIGTQCVFDKVHNNYYNERAIPVQLGYDLDILTTNTADMDEMIRELMFKYTSMYFLSIQIPYESDRSIRFGVYIDPDSTIERMSKTAEYLNRGQLYRSTLKLKCDGCVLLHYTPVKLRRQEYEITLLNPDDCV